jgi:PH and SEC7 domain-containing protein
LATKATDYTKKQHVFRLETADQSEYLFQTSDSKELQSWIDTINFVCASFSAPPLEGESSFTLQSSFASFEYNSINILI